jgi:hypothetical protein
MGTAGTARYHWNFPICPTRVTIDLSVVRALENDLATPGEQQGFLFGKELDAATHINGREPLAGFTRSEIEAALVNPRRTAVGFYRIREGRAFILTVDELEIARELFRKPNSVVLLVERRAVGAEASFFFWRGDSFVHNLPMPFPLDAAKLAGGEAVTARPRRRILWPFPVAVQRVGAIAAGAVFGVGIAAVTLRGPSTSARKPRVSTPPAVSATLPSRPGGGLEFFWDPKSMPAATAGLLEIDDGGVKRQIQLDSEQIHTGSVPYVTSSGHVQVSLSTLHRDGRVVDASVSVRPGTAPVQAEAPAPVPELPQPSPKEAAPIVSTPAPVASADRRVPTRQFVLTARATEPPSAPIELDPPAINAPAVNGAVLPIAPMLRTHIPPPAAPVVTHSVSSGRLIWTGTLLKRGVVEVVGKSASVGSISGALPGVPVVVTISPAEFEGNGLVVYTTDVSRNNRVEPASAANGWNRVTWSWDPARVGEISVLEPPNASNGYGRLAFRSDARRTSMVWIDWRARVDRP